MDTKNVWLITAKTNLHVGNENTTSFGLIDLAVQRNATTGLPCINSSSLKGALNEFAVKQSNISSENLVSIFGSDKRNRSNSKKGQYTFFDANLLFLPVQDDQSLFKLKTSHEVIRRFISQMKLFNIPINENEDDLLKELRERLNIQNEAMASFFDDDATMVEQCSDECLPIIARNVLDNGESKNLWYEQVVPAETVFYTIIDDKGKDTLANLLTQQGAMVQIGANATIGYGYCLFTNLSPYKNEKV